jgi:hypothetical protein
LSLSLDTLNLPCPRFFPIVIWVRIPSIIAIYHSCMSSDSLTIDEVAYRDILDSCYSNSEEQSLSVIVVTRKNFTEILELVDEKVFIEGWKYDALNVVPVLFSEKHIPLTLDNLIEHEYKPFGILKEILRNIKSPSKQGFMEDITKNKS